MTSAAQYPGDAERQVLNRLRAQYEAKGFEFLVEPGSQDVPAFLGSYRPDAIARGGDTSIAFEIRQRRGDRGEASLQELKRRFEEHPDWQFVVVYAADDPLKSASIAAASKEDIRKRVEAVRALDAQGEHRGAFVLAWGLLEASLLNIEQRRTAKPRTPGTVVQSLAMLGLLDSEAAHKMRPLISLRNRVVHGDLTAEPASEDVQIVLAAVDNALFNL
jgi:uncharacterized protein YutE (UPF0331/DUF86 family)